MHGGGLGFGFKWNMGFMNDTLRYMSRNPIHRRYHHNDMTFAALYAFSENYRPAAEPRRSGARQGLADREDGRRRLAAVRGPPRLLRFHVGLAGQKLLFMGQEFAQREEWNEAKGLDWWLLDAGMHEGVRRLVGDLNAAYRELPALHERDNEPEGFEWLIGNDHAQRGVCLGAQDAGRRAGGGDRQYDAGAARQISRAHAQGGQLGRADQYGCRLVRRHQYRQPGQGGAPVRSEVKEDGSMPDSTCRRWRRWY